jgi:hypothetical protein
MFLRRHFIHLRDEMRQDDGGAVQSAPNSVIPCPAACLGTQRRLHLVVLLVATL